MGADSYFLPRAADAADLDAWSSILPKHSRILRTNLFGDIFLIDHGGAVHMLERAGCAIDLIAPSEAEYWKVIEEDDQNWQLRPLVEACRAAGLELKEGECYAFTIPPVLGGEYHEDNIWVAPWEDWFSLTADLFEQIRDLPDGSTVSFKIID